MPTIISILRLYTISAFVWPLSFTSSLRKTHFTPTHRDTIVTLLSFSPSLRWIITKVTTTVAVCTFLELNNNNNNNNNNNKVKWSRYRPGVVQRVGRGIALLFHDRGIRRGWVFSSTPRPHFTPGKDPVPILEEAGWAPGPVWTGGKSRPHRDSIMDLQPVVSRYTDWATRPTTIIIIINFKVQTTSNKKDDHAEYSCSIQSKDMQWNLG